MFLLKGSLLLSCLTLLTVSASKKGPDETPWTSFVPKSAYGRALGPPASVMDTITVPYMPKSPFFPKFVDPKMMISKKTDMLSNLFGGTGSVYPPMGFKPYNPYTGSGSLYSTGDEAQFASTMNKNPMDGMNVPYKRGIFGPFGGKPFGPMGSKFGPVGQYSSFNAMPDYGMKDDYYRRKRNAEESPVSKLRAIMDTGKGETKNMGPPPPYPTLAPISEESEDDMNMLMKKFANPAAPKQYLPGMFGPFGPFGPMSPVVDPSMFMAKKSAFLDTLFKNLATTTPTPASTQMPTTKSTIVPPDFWFPMSAVPSPTDYNAKVSEFLDKLFETLKLNKTMMTSEEESDMEKTDYSRSLETDDDEKTQNKIARSVDDLTSINAAKDSIVNSILSELGDVKSNMVTTMNDLVAYEKSASMSTKKPFKSYAGGPWAKPPMDVMLPFQQKMAMLSQVFDMLTDLQKNITLAVQKAMKTKMQAAKAAADTFKPYYLTDSDSLAAVNQMPLNMSLLDAIKTKLDTMQYGSPFSYNPAFNKYGSSMARMASKSPASFWVPYPEDMSSIKRDVDNSPGFDSYDEGNFDSRQQARSVKMQMHQGYQSLPAGTIESVQAGGGVVPGHEGGGIKLFEPGNYEDYGKWADWMEYVKKNYYGQRHHDHHHH